jgi:hypothetical protein
MIAANRTCPKHAILLGLTHSGMSVVEWFPYAGLPVALRYTCGKRHGRNENISKRHSFPTALPG